MHANSAAACRACPVGQSSPRGSHSKSACASTVACDEGQYHHANESVQMCMPCARGEYKAAGVGACQTCPPGAFADAERASESLSEYRTYSLYPISPEPSKS